MNLNNELTKEEMIELNNQIESLNKFENRLDTIIYCINKFPDIKNQLTDYYNFICVEAFDIYNKSKELNERLDKNILDRNST